MLKLVHEISIPVIAPFNQHNTLFIDIETDGLSHKNTIVIIGLIYYESFRSIGKLIQLFNEDYHSEREMLMELIKLINQSDIDYLISFNGNSFDLPFLNARFNHYKIDFVLNRNSNIDLLRLAKANQNTLGIKDFKLKTIEKFVGINRNDIISGKDSIIMYHAYIESRSEAIKNVILLHNYDDLINMIPLLKLSEELSNFMNPYKLIFNQKWYISNIQIKENALFCSLSLNSRLSINELFYNSLGIQFTCSNINASLKIDLLHFKDNNSNSYKFADSKFLYGCTIDILPEVEKIKLLISKNEKLIVPNTNDLIFNTISNLLTLIFE